MPRTHQFRRLLLLWGATALCLFLFVLNQRRWRPDSTGSNETYMIITGNPAHRTKPRAKKR